MPASLPRPTLRLAVCLALATLAAPLTGCGDVLADRCDAICSCENCGDRDLERCEIEVGTDLDVAAAYGCIDELEAYYECQLEEFECNGREYEDDNRACLNEREDYQRCQDAGSSREGGPY
jgi:hypothetical protein